VVNGRARSCDASIRSSIEEVTVIQQGQVFKLKARGAPTPALRWLLGKATAVLGPVRLADLSAKDVYAWRQTVPEGHRFEATQAIRQVLRRAVEWEWLSDNPAKHVPNPQRRAKEKRPFESWEEIEAVAAQLRPVYGPMVAFAAATGLRPSELFGRRRS
jgi:integrase